MMRTTIAFNIPVPTSLLLVGFICSHFSEQGHLDVLHVHAFSSPLFHRHAHGHEHFGVGGHKSLPKRSFETKMHLNLFEKKFFHLNANGDTNANDGDEGASEMNRARISLDEEMELEAGALHFASDMRTREEGNNFHDNNDGNAKSSISSMLINGETETSTTSKSPSLSSLMSNSTVTADVTLTETMKQVQNFVISTRAFLANIFNSQFGTRGEFLLIAQALLLYSIAFNQGHVPLIKQLVKFILGPVLFWGGAVLSIVAVRNMNYAEDRVNASDSTITSTVATNGATTSSSAEKDKGFTLFHKPRSSRLITHGLYQYIRHPFYAGNLAMLTGYSILTKSAMSLVLTGIYYKFTVVNMMKREEEELEKAFGIGVCVDYWGRVVDRIVPMKFLAGMLERVGKNARDANQKVKVKTSEIKGKVKGKVKGFGTSTRVQTGETSVLEGTKDNDDADSSSDTGSDTIGIVSEAKNDATILPSTDSSLKNENTTVDDAIDEKVESESKPKLGSREKDSSPKPPPPKKIRNVNGLFP